MIPATRALILHPERAAVIHAEPRPVVHELRPYLTDGVFRGSWRRYVVRLNGRQFECVLSVSEKIGPNGTLDPRMPRGFAIYFGDEPDRYNEGCPTDPSLYVWTPGNSVEFDDLHRAFTCPDTGLRFELVGWVRRRGRPVPPAWHEYPACADAEPCRPEWGEW
ncbi:MAG TPA: hypothetical protein VD948_05765 [Rhodothermales bacterium]|nr:hypothetical protein [Rhodothermales bacterium]